MTDIKGRLTEAADYLEYLFEDSKHIPADLVHDRDFRVGLVRTETEPAAQFFYGGAAEVFLTLGPGVLPLLAQWLRTEERTLCGDEDHKWCTAERCTACAAEELADHVLKAKEKSS